MPDMDWTPVYNEFMRLIEENYTNEEWFCQLPTEQKAKFLGEKVWVENNRLDYLHRAEAWERWLKQPHREE